MPKKLSPTQELFLACVKAEGRLSWEGHENGWYGAVSKWDNAVQNADNPATGWVITSATGRSLVRKGLLVEIERGAFVLAQ